MRKIASLLYGVLFLQPVHAQEPSGLTKRMFDGLEYRTELQLSGANGKTPLWLNANKYGLSSLNKFNGYLRGALERPVRNDSAHQWGVGYGLDVAVAQNYTSRLIVQQVYLETRWLKGALTVGSKHQPMELLNDELSSGTQTLGINARPIPQVRLSLSDYWVPRFTKGWVGIKGHVAYGMYTDKNWQQEFTGLGEHRYVDNILYHSKAGYLRIGNEEEFPATFEFGLEMAAQFGGTAYFKDHMGALQVQEGGKGIKDFYRAFVPGGSDVGETTYQNAAGNLLGSYMVRVSIDDPSWRLRFYGDHFFEDHSSMLFLDYNGYGTGENWNVKEKRKFVLYKLSDFLVGAEVTFKTFPWIRNVVLEYLTTKYQSGPLYHDHTPAISEHVSGRDDYYNHFFYNSWQHWGQVMGNPLYRSPIYNEDGDLRIKNSRFKAIHLGLSGRLNTYFHHRVLASYQKGFGTYSEPFTDPQSNVSLLVEGIYELHGRRTKGWSVRGAIGADFGKILGNNYGLQFTIVKSGILNAKQ